MKNNKKGFTLMETLVYLALFSLLIGGAAISAYSSFESSGRTGMKVMLQEEGSFLLAKVAWALSSGHVSNPVVAVSGTDITLKRDTNQAMILNNSNVEVSNLSIIHTAQTAGEEIRISFTLSTHLLNGQNIAEDFSTVSYVQH